MTNPTGATLENWRLQPHSAWGFRNVRSLIPTANIRAEARNAQALPIADRELDAISFETAVGKTKTVADVLAEGDTDGFLVLHRGAVLTERYANGLSPEQPHLMMSVSKSLTSTLTAIVIDRGDLTADTEVSTLLPEVKNSVYSNVTVRHLLDMTVATGFEEDNDDPEGDAAYFDAVAGWRPRPPDVADTYEFLASLQAIGAHGERVLYSSPNTDVLGWLLERVVGRPVAQQLSEEIWLPMGAEFDAYITVDPSGAAATNGGVCASLRDLARFGQLCLDRGESCRKRIVPEAWFNDTIENADIAAWKRGDIAEMVPLITGYRNNWWVTGNDHRAYTGVGIYGQWLYIDPEAEMVIAKFSSQPLAIDLDLMDDALRAFHAIACQLASG